MRWILQYRFQARKNTPTLQCAILFAHMENKMPCDKLNVLKIKYPGVFGGKHRNT